MHYGWLIVGLALIFIGAGGFLYGLAVGPPVPKNTWLALCVGTMIIGFRVAREAIEAAHKMKEPHS